MGSLCCWRPWASCAKRVSVGRWFAQGQFFRELDGQTLLLLASLFVIIAGITRAGVIDAISRLFVNIAGDDLFAIYSLIVMGFGAFLRIY